MGRRPLTDAEIAAYQEMARAARKLEEAKRAAEAAGHAKKRGIALSLYEPEAPARAPRKGGGRGQ
jgi:hypothetical protein